VTATNNTLIIIDIIKGFAAIICGNIGIPPLLLYIIGVIQPALQIPFIFENILLSSLCLLITIYAYHTTRNKIIRALVVIGIFVPVILMLLSYFSVLKVPLPF
jgi:TM2 domain-containing membrane protein YozV